MMAIRFMDKLILNLVSEVPSYRISLDRNSCHPRNRCPIDSNFSQCALL
jgi:hypothetical protein